LPICFVFVEASTSRHGEQEVGKNPEIGCIGVCAAWKALISACRRSPRFYVKKCNDPGFAHLRRWKR
jgi:hypothetical protein